MDAADLDKLTTVEVGAAGSGTELIERFRAERQQEIAGDMKHHAAVLTCLSAAARLQSLECERVLGNIILTPEKDGEYARLKRWWVNFGAENQVRLCAMMHDLAADVEQCARYF